MSECAEPIFTKFSELIDRLVRIIFLARSANLPTGLYILLALIF